MDYSVKYVILSVIKPGYINVGVKNDNNVMGYIVSKAFLVDEVKIYSKDNNDYLYAVAMPYRDIKDNEIVYPEYNEFNDVSNGYIVDMVFDSEYKAREYANKLNTCLRDNKLLNIYGKYKNSKRLKNKMEKAKEDFDYDMNTCYELESELLSKEEKIRTIKK